MFNGNFQTFSVLLQNGSKIKYMFVVMLNLE